MCDNQTYKSLQIESTPKRKMSNIGHSINCYDERYNKISLPKPSRPRTGILKNKLLAHKMYATSNEPNRDSLEINKLFGNYK